MPSAKDRSNITGYYTNTAIIMNVFICLLHIFLGNASVSFLDFLQGKVENFISRTFRNCTFEREFLNGKKGISVRRYVKMLKKFACGMREEKMVEK